MKKRKHFLKIILIDVHIIGVKIVEAIYTKVGISHYAQLDNHRNYAKRRIMKVALNNLTERQLKKFKILVRLGDSEELALKTVLTVSDEEYNEKYNSYLHYYRD